MRRKRSQVNKQFSRFNSLSFAGHRSHNFCSHALNHFDVLCERFSLLLPPHFFFFFRAILPLSPPSLSRATFPQPSFTFPEWSRYRNRMRGHNKNCNPWWVAKDPYLFIIFAFFRRVNFRLLLPPLFFGVSRPDSLSQTKRIFGFKPSDFFFVLISIVWIRVTVSFDAGLAFSLHNRWRLLSKRIFCCLSFCFG